MPLFTNPQVTDLTEFTATISIDHTLTTDEWEHNASVHPAQVGFVFWYWNLADSEGETVASDYLEEHPPYTGTFTFNVDTGAVPIAGLFYFFGAGACDYISGASDSYLISGSTITTLPADQIGYAGQTARLNGSGGTSFGKVYFQYGQSSGNLNLSTNPKAGTATFSQFISGLNPGVIYYFRAVGRNTSGGSYVYTYGEELSFLSPGQTPPTPPAARTTGYMWVEGTAVHITDDSNLEKAFLGTNV